MALRNKSPRATDVLIVGAGPTGLMLALWLARLGVNLRIIDKTSTPGTTSRALVMHARTLEFYRQLGIDRAALARGLPFAAANLWARGEHAGRVQIGDIGEGESPFPYMLILPQDQQEVLLIEALDEFGVSVERDTQLVTFEDHGEGLSAQLATHDSFERIDCGWIAGCDGAHSTVRETLGLAFPGATYKHVFYVADVQARGPAVNGELNVALDEADLLAFFPLPGKNNVRLIGTVKPEAEDAQVELEWKDVSSKAMEHMRLEVDHVNWFSTYHVHHRVVDHFRQGRAFVLGDAAHVHSPVGAQGMNTGLGDAVNLAWKLAMVIRRRAPETLLDTYESERIAFARRLVATTDRAFTFVNNDGPIARFVRLDIIPRLLPAALTNETARRFFFRTLSQIEIEYRDSALSTGHAGEVHGGDRLPWVPDNFTPLQSLEWQAHVFRVPRPGLSVAVAAASLAVDTLPSNDVGEQDGIAREALYLVRPDGYVALADADADPRTLEKYWDERELVLVLDRDITQRSIFSVSPGRGPG